MIQEKPAPVALAKVADHYFSELEMARRSLASDLGDSWPVIRSARLSANKTEQHENLAFAVEAEGLKVVVEVVSWGWRQAAAGKREVGHQCGTFSGAGRAWSRLLDAHRSAHGQDVKPAVCTEVDGKLLTDEERVIWIEWRPTSLTEADKRVRWHRMENAES